MWRRASFAPIAVVLLLLLVSAGSAAGEREAKRGEPLAGGGRPPPTGPTEPTEPSEPPDPTRPREPDQPGEPATPPPAAPACGGPVLCAAEVAAIVTTAATALSADTLTVAVVDRLGNPLALFRKPGATGADDDRAVGLARTAAWFSNDQAPLSSRTVRFVSGIHFPPGIARAPNAALYGIENTNRGCSLNAPLDPGAALAEGRSVAGILGSLPCDPFDSSGCGPGVVTGKADAFDSVGRAVDPGGVPIFRPATGGSPAHLLGGVGVAGTGPEAAEFAAFTAAFAAATAAVPRFPLPPPGNVFIDGVRLPFVEQTRRPGGTAAGPPAGAYVLGPHDGTPAADGYLIGPIAGSQLNAAEVDRIVQQAVAAAARTRAVIRLPVGSRTRMAIAVADPDGALLALFRMPDATVFSLDVAAAKARNVGYLSGNPAAQLDLPGVPAGTAVTSRTLSFGAQPLYPPGIDGTVPGPFFDLFLFDAAHPCSQGHEPPHANQNGVVFFPGSLPLYRGGALVGGLGVSGDGVDQDDYVSFLGAAGFQPPPAIWADRVFVRGVRLPFLRFPRSPEGQR
jgi:uncharacterized protein GlcG (DUF336 family)